MILTDVDNSTYKDEYQPVSISPSELLSIFPEAIPVVKNNIKRIKACIQRVKEKHGPLLDAALTRIYASDMTEGQQEIAIMLVKWWYEDRYMAVLERDLKEQEGFLKLHAVRVATKDSPQEINENTIRGAKAKKIEELASFPGHHGRAGFIRCPFHSEKTASCKVEKNRFHCFGCGEDGDVIDWVMKIEGRTFREAVLELNKS